MDPRLKKTLKNYQIYAIGQSRTNWMLFALLIAAGYFVTKQQRWIWLGVGIFSFWMLYLRNDLHKKVFDTLQKLWKEDCDPAVAAKGYAHLAALCRDPMQCYFLKSAAAQAFSESGQFEESQKLLLSLSLRDEAQKQHGRRFFREQENIAAIQQLHAKANAAFLEGTPARLWELREEAETVIPQRELYENKVALLCKLRCMVLLQEGDFVGAQQQAQILLQKVVNRSDQIQAYFASALANWQEQPGHAKRSLQEIAQNDGSLWCCKQAEEILLRQKSSVLEVLNKYPPKENPVSMPQEQMRVKRKGVWNLWGMEKKE